jgi:hypothetical protein
MVYDEKMRHKQTNKIAGPKYFFRLVIRLEHDMHKISFLGSSPRSGPLRGPRAPRPKRPTGVSEAPKRPAGITEWSTTHRKSKPLKIQNPRNSPTFPVTQPKPKVGCDRKYHESTRLAKSHNYAEHCFPIRSLPGKILGPKPNFNRKSSPIRRIFQPTPKVVAGNDLWQKDAPHIDAQNSRSEIFFPPPRSAPANLIS